MGCKALTTAKQDLYKHLAYSLSGFDIFNVFDFFFAFGLTIMIISLIYYPSLINFLSVLLWDMVHSSDAY